MKAKRAMWKLTVEFILWRIGVLLQLAAGDWIVVKDENPTEWPSWFRRSKFLKLSSDFFNADVGKFPELLIFKEIMVVKHKKEGKSICCKVKI